MHTIPGPMFGWGELDRTIEHRLEGNKNRAKLLDDTLRCFTIAIELGKPLVVDRAALKDKRLANDELHVGKSVFGAFQESHVIILVNIDSALVVAS